MTILAWGGLAAVVITVALVVWATRDEDPEARQRREWWNAKQRERR